MSLISLRVDWCALLIQKWSDQRARNGKVDVCRVYDHLALVIACHGLDCLLVRVRFDKAMDLVRINVLQIVIVDLHPGILQDLFCRDAFICLFMEQFLKEEASRGTHVIREL